jgi:hypothetical protein
MVGRVILMEMIKKERGREENEIRLPPLEHET